MISEYHEACWCGRGTPAAHGVRFTYELAIENREEELSRLGAWVGEIARIEEFSAYVKFSIDLCLAEVTTNVICHGFPHEGGHWIAIRLDCSPSTVVIRVEDDGIAFDPLEQLATRPPKTLEEAPIGKLGLPILREYTTAMRYVRERGRNVLTLLLPGPDFRERAG